MALEPPYCLDAAESTMLEISTEGLHALLSQVEAELQHSEVYRKVTAGLQTLLGEASDSAQTLIKVVSREAIRLAFQQFAREYTSATQATPADKTDNTSTQADTASSAPVTDQKIKSGSIIAPITGVPDSIVHQSREAIDYTTSHSKPQKQLAPKPPKKRSKVEVAAQMLAQEREEHLRQLGQHLKQVRESRSLSVKQLHTLTLVPIHQLEALEAGRIEQLPEDIYVRGFLRRISNALGLDGDRIAASLPAGDPNAGVIPSWSRSKVEPRFCLRPVHLYLGYVALMAGAAGGLTLLSQKSSPDGAIGATAAPPASTSISQASRNPSAASPGLRSTGSKSIMKGMRVGGFVVGNDIAPPETTL